ncbi:transporter substrate-binding domain-containing protein [Saccharospirillum salsuginis]|uniref:histidine kinase n=1 Tax=Saccharospirillum salsuginis TaxID=418750 RepID=A0A918KBX3_9GAMM|nr:transporter substrate-binding domain-containing protein [Saccharospirillum salsuginis]GGX58218.1 histidine kinase [Saccharospirillum salsuginis]
MRAIVNLALQCLLVLTPAGMLLAENAPVIRVGGDDSYPPYEFIDKEGNIAGYNVDMTRAIAEVMGIDVDITLASWSEMRAALENGDMDVLQGMVASEEREKQFSFSAPSVIVNYSFFARKGDPEPESYDDLAGKSVVVQNEGIVHDFLRENDYGVDIIPVRAHSDALRQLAAGNYDYALGATLPSLYFSREHKLSNIGVVWRPLKPQPYGYAVRKGNEETLALFSEGLAILKNTGRQQEIYDKWLGTLETPDTQNWQWIAIGAGIVYAVLLLGIGIVTIWIRTLQRQVERRTEEVKQQQQQLIQADKMSSLGTLVSGVAHEINNPSGLILLNLPMLKDAWEDSMPLLDRFYAENGGFDIGGVDYQRIRDEIPYVLNEMNEGAQRIKRIVNDLRDFARQEATDTAEPINLNEVVSTAARLLDVTIRGYTNKFNLLLDPYLPSMLGNAQRIEQVVINLIINACQALPDPQHGVKVETRIDHGSQRIVLAVHDEGCGIPPEAMANLTDPFFTTKREQGGTGLGLSVSAGIINAYDGEIRFHSKPGAGTRVEVTFPWNRNETA